MEIIANTASGFLIQATENELKEIINAVTGSRPDKLAIGQKIPAIDYASTITKIKALGESYDFKKLIEAKNQMNSTIDLFRSSIEQASKIQL